MLGAPRLDLSEDPVPGAHGLAAPLPMADVEGIGSAADEPALLRAVKITVPEPTSLTESSTSTDDGGLLAPSLAEPPAARPSFRDCTPGLVELLVASGSISSTCG